jgi:uncharacterized protein (TIGR02145 family)
MDKNNSLEKYNHSLIRVSKQIAITNKLLKKTIEIVTDIDGNIYHTVKIGTQVWMLENLNASHYRNGEIIPEAKTDEEWKEAGTMNQSAWCYYNNKLENGKLYNWYAVTNQRNICPVGYHIPTHAEWKILTDFLNIESGAGGKIKEDGTSHWESLSTEADNSSNFSPVPVSFRNWDGSFNSDDGDYCTWWSSTDRGTIGAWGRDRDMNYYLCRVAWHGNNRTNGFSVRCIKDY